MSGEIDPQTLAVLSVVISMIMTVGLLVATYVGAMAAARHYALRRNLEEANRLKALGYRVAAMERHCILMELNTLSAGESSVEKEIVYLGLFSSRTKRDKRERRKEK